MKKVILHYLSLHSSRADLSRRSMLSLHSSRADLSRRSMLSLHSFPARSFAPLDALAALFPCRSFAPLALARCAEDSWHLANANWSVCIAGFPPRPPYQSKLWTDAGDGNPFNRNFILRLGSVCIIFAG